MKRKWLPWLVLIVAYIAAFAANVGHFAWGYEIGWAQVSTSVLYAAAWIWFVVSGRNNKMRLQAACWACWPAVLAADFLPYWVWPRRG